MDKLREKTKKNPIKKYWFLFVALISLIILFMSASWHTAGFVVGRDTVVFDAVKRGDLDILVRASGELTSKNIRWISANSPGRVESLHIQAGDEVKQGDILAVLNNPLLQQQLEEAQLQLEIEETEAKAEIIDLDSQLEEQRSLLQESELNYEATYMTFEAQKQLIQQGNATVSQIEFKRSELEVRRFELRKLLQEKRVARMEKNVESQKDAILTRLDIMKKTLKSLEQRVENLRVKAAFDSVVQDLFIEAGQELALGANIATLAKKDDLIAELRVPEIQIQKVTVGQKVEIDTRTSRLPGKVSRIHPGVTNGTIQVDVELLGALPREARADMSIDGVINIANISDTLFIKRPVYAQGSSSTRLYKLDSSGGEAELVMVQFGEASADTIQITKGLVLGDRVVVSDTSSWGDHGLIRFN
ncbi:HlyD family efflux transporter periplasmic adaptor subunit [Thalassomonas viridans]|uniref:HlyD family efflux transporter periplasmic adaptor subunit n=1 Tax=Thalassomonas viridans TaxID=137584 RepID=A0AAE9Z9G9_9GAMM|nr:HlyD family efflux transporter periplasmic adaptor subunit [Thalassomonas viridans]WDE09186.1 HlyD family efflux transporter periplasmic adaptor subunit [Thalassomonas viridans]